ncbi:MAG: leucine--tRNA ligase [Candidatus Lokiarchaeota archaeon]|nr:leucine--tRNA ligase [Candidatus Lokiarchaeota archaeon]
MVEYNSEEIEKKWQEKWEKDKIFEVKVDQKKKKYYVLEMYPYPSGKLHMGHLRNYTIGDCYARFKRMNGFNVIYPMGYDSFGMPAENAAIDHGINPEEWTEKNIDTMMNQQKRIGLSYDWTREIYSHNPNFYKWDQWFFLQMLEKNLAYKQESYVNWCPKCATVIANEQAQGGKCWRCNSVVDQKFLTQWFLKIRDYAEELLQGLDIVDWPDKVKIMQRNWIGKSEGTIIKFPIVGEKRTVDIFTTRPDTLFGVTFMVFAPEHPWVREWVTGTEYEEDFKILYEEVMHQDRFERTDIEIKKKGMFIGKHAINPINNEEVPIYIGNFVIYEYGAGAVMAVPGHDQRDFEFAKEYNIPIKIVIQPYDYEINETKMTRAYESDGILANSEEFNGMENRSAINAVTEKLNQNDMGHATINYKLRDWGISRQRYWGCPIPVIYCKKCGMVPVPYNDLPVFLPKDVSFDGIGNPLQTSKSFVNTRCPKCGNDAKRETDTMDTFVDSSWYFFAFCDPPSVEAKIPYNKDIVNYWGNVDQYIGGIEHAIMHLIYARFFTKVTRDLGLHKFDEPFQSLLTQGMINKVHPFCPNCNAFLMEADLEKMKCKICGNTDLIQKSVKMSKSYGNTVDPGEIIEKYGADAARFFILFGASPSSGLEWSEEGVDYAYRFIKNTFILVSEPPEIIREELNVRDTLVQYYMNKTIKEFTENMKDLAIRNAVNNVIQFASELGKYKNEGVNKEIYKDCLEKLTLLLHPIAPHMTEEIWESFGKKGYLSLATWPSYNKDLLSEESDFKWKLMNSILEDINNIRTIVKKETIESISLIIADSWKLKFYNTLMKILEETINQGEVMKQLMKDNEFKKHSSQIGKIVSIILRNIGKYPKYTLSSNEEYQFFSEIKPIIERKFKCQVEVTFEKDSKEQKATQSLPGKPAIVII